MTQEPDEDELALLRDRQHAARCLMRVAYDRLDLLAEEVEAVTSEGRIALRPDLLIALSEAEHAHTGCCRRHEGCRVRPRRCHGSPHRPAANRRERGVRVELGRSPRAGAGVIAIHLVAPPPALIVVAGCVTVVLMPKRR